MDGRDIRKQLRGLLQEQALCSVDMHRENFLAYQWECEEVVDNVSVHTHARCEFCYVRLGGIEVFLVDNRERAYAIIFSAIANQ